MLTIKQGNGHVSTLMFYLQRRKTVGRTFATTRKVMIYYQILVIFACCVKYMRHLIGLILINTRSGLYLPLTSGALRSTTYV